MRRIRFPALLAAAVLAAALTTAPPAGAAFPGQPGKIAFRTDRGGHNAIYTASSNGADQQALTDAPGTQSLDPAWSPDGRWVAFARKSQPLGGTHLYAIRAGGFGLTRLTNVPMIDRQPAWSPDGTRILFTRGNEDNGAFAIWSIGVDGSWPHPITGATEHVFNGSPAWSPDGTTVAFVSNRAGGFPKLFVMSPDGSNHQMLSSGTWMDGNPAWSPDGTMIAFDRCCPGGHSSIYVTTPFPGPVTRITDDSIEASNPAWSPDGTHIAFVGFPPGGGNRDIYSVSVDGTGLTQLTSDPASDLSPDWQPVTPHASSRSKARPALARERSTEATSSPARTAAPPKHHHKKKPKPRFTRKTTKVAPGLTLTRIVDRKIPERIFALKVDPTTALTMDVALAGNQLPGFETVRSMAGRHHAIAAVNGDFGWSSGRPLNIFAEDGDLKQTMFGWGNNFSISQDERKEHLGHPVTSVVARVASTGESFEVQRVNEGRTPVFGEISEFTPPGGYLVKPPVLSCSARLHSEAGPHWDTDQRSVVRDYVVDRAGCFPQSMKRGDGIVLSAFPTDDEALMLRALRPGEVVTLSWSLGWHQTMDAIGGFPMLIKDGRIVAEGCRSRFCGRNPRTGVGLTEDGRIIMAVVDGRRDRYSRGMTITGWARQMKQLGAVWAMNMDGGGSSTMVVRGRVINRPSDPGGPRHVSSALLVLPGPDRGEPSMLGPSVRVRHRTPGFSIGAIHRGPTAMWWRLAARDPASTGGLIDAVAGGGLGPRGIRVSAALLRVLSLYRAR